MAKKTKFNGRILMIGYGSVGHCTMPLIAKHFDMPLSRVTVVEMDDHSEEIAPYVAKGVTYEIKEITRRNFKQVLAKYAGRGDLVLNLSVSVSSHEVLEWCQKHGALYLDTCIEPWPGYYDNPKIPAHQRSNYHLRYQAKEMAKKWPQGSPSAILTMGANPGLISHFVKAGILEIARDKNPKLRKPTTRECWARLAMDIGLKVIHVAERDTQVANVPKRMDEFVNTWSIHGFVRQAASGAFWQSRMQRTMRARRGSPIFQPLLIVDPSLTSFVDPALTEQTAFFAPWRAELVCISSPRSSRWGSSVVASSVSRRAIPGARKPWSVVLPRSALSPRPMSSRNRRSKAAAPAAWSIPSRSRR